MGFRSSGGNSRSTGNPVFRGGAQTVTPARGDDISAPMGEPAEDLAGEVIVPSTPQPAIRGTKANVASVPAMLFGNQFANPDRSKTATEDQSTPDLTRGP